MWNRNRYGSGATAMRRTIRCSGSASEHIRPIAFDYVRRVAATRQRSKLASPQFVEFGAIGSLGWILWYVMFAIFVLKCQNATMPRRGSRAACLSPSVRFQCLACPGQAVTVAITFWTIAFWYVSLSRARSAAAAPCLDGRGRPLSRSRSSAAAGTAQLAATTKLRVPERAIGNRRGRTRTGSPRLRRSTATTAIGAPVRTHWPCSMRRRAGSRSAFGRTRKP